MEKMIEDLLNKGYTYDSFRESESKDQLNNIMNEAQIGGTMQFTNGEASGRALAGANADKGIRDVTDGAEGRGQAEVDKTGIYVGIPAGPDKTAWANPVAAKQAMSPEAGKRVDAYQAAYKAAPAAEKAAMQDWTPEQPDMIMDRNRNVIDTNTGKVMPTAAKAAPAAQPKSSILGGLKKAFLGENTEMNKEELFEAVLKESEFSPEEDYIDNLKAAAKELGATYEGGWFGKGICGYTNGVGWALNMGSTPAYGLQTYLLARKGSRVSVMNASASSGKDRVSNPENSVESIVELIQSRLADICEEKNSKVEVLKKLEKKIDNYGIANDTWLDGEVLKVFCDADKEDDVYDAFADFRDEVTPEFIVDYRIARGDEEEDGTTEVMYTFMVED